MIRRPSAGIIDAAYKQKIERVNITPHTTSAQTVTRMLNTGMCHSCMDRRPSHRCNPPVPWSTLSIVHPELANGGVKLSHLSALATSRHRSCTSLKHLSPSNSVANPTEP